AGAGTRMRSATPKVLHPLAGRTMLAHALHAAGGAAPAHLVVVVGHQAEAVSAEADRVGAQLGAAVTTVVQPRQDGTGHAVACGRGGLPADCAGTVVVTAADVPLLDAPAVRSLVDTHRDAGAAVSLLTTTVDDPTGYGRVLRADDDAVTGIVEQADADEAQRAVRETNSAVYAFDAAFLRTALGTLDSDNAQGEIYLTDTVAAAHAAGAGVGALHLDDAQLVSGVNDRVQLSVLT